MTSLVDYQTLWLMQPLLPFIHWNHPFHRVRGIVITIVSWNNHWHLSVKSALHFINFPLVNEILFKLVIEIIISL